MHCGNWWLGVGAHRYEQHNGALVSARFDSHNTGRVCVSAAGDSVDLSRQCPPERKKRERKTSLRQWKVYSSTCQSLSVSALRTALLSLSRTRRYGWYTRQWVGSWDGKASFPLLPPLNQNHRWVRSPYWSDIHTHFPSKYFFFNSESCRCRWLFLLGEAMKKGVAWMKNDLLADWWCSFILRQKTTFFFSVDNTHPHEGNHCIVTTLSTSEPV